MGMFNTVVGGLQGALSGDWTSFASGLLSGASQDYENLQAKLAAKRANQEQIAFWNMQNAYNSPVEQMARLKEAGLNPMLVYGGGNVAGNAASAIGTAQTVGNKTNYQASLQGIKAIADLDNLKANTANTEQNTQAQTANTLATYQDITNMETANQIQQQQLEQERQAVELGAMDLEVARAVQEDRVEQAKIDARLGRNQSEYEGKYKDNTLVRAGRDLLDTAKDFVGLGKGLSSTQAGFSTARRNDSVSRALNNSFRRR